MLKRLLPLIILKANKNSALPPVTTQTCRKQKQRINNNGNVNPVGGKLLGDACQGRQHCLEAGEQKTSRTESRSLITYWAWQHP